MILAVDLGGTHLRWRISKDGETHKIRTAGLDIMQFFNDILTSNPQITSIGMAFAGHTKDGVLISAPNIEISNLDLKTILKEKYSVNFFCDNDLKCAVRAEASIRPNDKSVLAMFIGTGLGGAFWDNGAIVRGCTNLAGEVGHIPFKPGSIVCGCGKNDCVEIYASGHGLDAQLNAVGLKHENLTQIKQDAPDIYSNFIGALTHAASTLITLLNPSVLVLGGGIIEAEKWIADILTDSVKNHTFAPALKDARIEISSFDNAVLEGAYLLAL